MHINGVCDKSNPIPSEFPNNFCYVSISEEDARNAQRIYLWYTPNIGRRNHACSEASLETAQSTSLSLSFLRACRQNHREAHEITNGENTFSLSKTEVLQGFLESLDRRGPE